MRETLTSLRTGGHYVYKLNPAGTLSGINSGIDQVPLLCYRWVVFPQLTDRAELRLAALLRVKRRELTSRARVWVNGDRIEQNSTKH